MMMNMEALKQLANSLLNRAFRYDEFDRYVGAYIPYSITMPDGHGGEMECISVKMEAIYDCYRNNPDSGIDKKFYEALLKGTSTAVVTRIMVAMLRTIEYQIMAENAKIAPFKIDNDVLLLNIKENLIKNRELYNSKRFQNEGFFDLMQQHNNDLMENYGRKIM